jgi:hypothetical protein
LKTLFWDIEMRPLETYTWSLFPDSIPIVMVKKTQRIMSWAARWHHSPRMFYMDERDGYEVMLDGIWNLLDEADAVVSWNGKGFDSKQIRRAFSMAGMVPPSPWKEIDLMLAVKSQMKFASNKLDHVAQEFGVGHKNKVDMDLWLDCMGDNGPEAMEAGWRKMKRYNKQDVNLLVDLYDLLLPWLPYHPNVALINGIPFACPTCGSTELQKRGFFYSNAGVFQRYRCNACGAWPHDSKRLATVELRGGVNG